MQRIREQKRREEERREEKTCGHVRQTVTRNKPPHKRCPTALPHLLCQKAREMGGDWEEGGGRYSSDIII